MIHMAQDEDMPRRYPYVVLEEFRDEAFNLLPLSMKEDEVHIPTLAKKVLEELLSTGLLHRRDTEPPENIRKAKVGNKQDIWIQFDTYRDGKGYMAVDVVDAPRSDAAILAVMTAFLLEPVDPEELAKAIEFRSSEARTTQEERVEAISKKLQDEPEGVTSDEL